jgi:hypothetical protein
MYGWYVDNVKFIEGYTNDLKLQDNYAFTGTQAIQFTKIQKNQTGSAAITFAGYVNNNASNSQDAVLTVTGPASFSATNATPLAIVGYDSDSIVTSPNFTIPTTVGTSAFNYVVTSSNHTLDNTTDDTKSYSIEVTNEDMGVDAYTNPASISGSFIGWASGTGDPGIGSLIEIFNATDAINVKVGIANIGASQQATYLGHQFYGKLHVYNTVTDAFDYVDQTPTHDIVAADFGNIVSINFNSPVALTPGLYLVTAGFSSTEDAPIAFSGFVPQGQTMGWDGTSTVSLIGNSSYHKMVEAPVVRLGVSNSASIKESSLASDVAIYPNPFVGTTDIKLNLKNDASVSAIVTDLAGRTVATVPAKNVATGEHTISINGTNFQAGMYNVVLTIGGETITKRIVKN